MADTYRHPVSLRQYSDPVVYFTCPSSGATFVEVDTSASAAKLSGSKIGRVRRFNREEILGWVRQGTDNVPASTPTRQTGKAQMQ